MEHDVRLVREMLQRGEAVAALARARLLCEQHPGRRGLLELQVEAAVGAGANDAAVLVLDELCGRWPQDLRYLTKRAELRLAAGDAAAAVASYEQALALQPRLPALRYYFGRLLAAIGENERAFGEFEAALELGIATPADALTCQANALVALNRPEPARERLQRALALDPEFEPALFNLASLLEEAGERDAARAGYARLAARNPRFPQVLTRLAHLQEFSDPADPLMVRMRQQLDDPATDEQARESLHFGLGKASDDCGDHDAAFAHYSAGNRMARRHMPVYDRSAHAAWVDSIAARCDAAWLDTVPPVSNRRLVFICGMFRSGTTLFEQVLAAHPDIAAGGELTYFPRVCRSRIVPYPEALSSTDADALAAIGRGYLELLQLRNPGAARVTDKRPDNFLYLGLIKGLFPRARVVFARRDPLDNALSVFAQNLDERLNYATDIGDILHYHGEMRRLMRHWQALFGADILELSYDRFVADQEAETRRLLDFCGLGWHEDCLAFHRRGGVVRTASVWQVRKPLYQSSSGRWTRYRRHLEPWIEQAAAIERT